jgi:hypothetical protein
MVAGDTPANAESQQIFYVSYPEGSVRQMTNDLSSFTLLTSTASPTSGASQWTAALRSS